MGQFRIGAALPSALVSRCTNPASAWCAAPGALWFMCPHIQDRRIAAYACTPEIECVDKEEGLVFTLDDIPAAKCVADIRKNTPEWCSSMFSSRDNGK